jgi:hypothetical protein
LIVIGFAFSERKSDCTYTVSDPEIGPEELSAEMIEFPTATPVTSPFSSIDATEGSADRHVTGPLKK